MTKEPRGALETYTRGCPLLDVRYEWLGITSTVVAFLALVLVIANRYYPHADEVMYAETSANIAGGLGPIATTHANVVPGDRIAVAYVPFVYAEAAWLRTFGVTRFAVQSFNIVLVATAMVLLWLYLRRSEILRRPSTRIFVVAAMPLLASLATLYSTNRYDVIAVLGIAVGLVATTVPWPLLRYALLIVGGLFVGGDGFHPAIVAPGLACLAWWYFGRTHTADLIAFVCGAALGIVLTFGEMAWNGTFANFRLLMQHNAVRMRSLWDVVYAPFKPHSNIRDNALCMMALAVALLGMPLSSSASRTSRVVWTGLAIGFGVPMCLTWIGRYNHTYAWLGVLPMFFCVCWAVEQGNVNRSATQLAVALLVIAVLSGVPLKAVYSATEADRNSYASVDQWIESKLSPDDVAYGSYAAYYPVKRRSRQSFFGAAIHSMTDSQRESVNVAVFVHDSAAKAMFELPHEEVLHTLGGNWEEVADMEVARSALREIIPPRPKGGQIFAFTIYRRIKT